MAIGAVLLDLDGTVYEGNRLIEGADKAVAHMRDFGVRVFFCTNNSSKPRKSISDKLNSMGISCSEEDVLTSGQMCIDYVLEHSLSKVYVSGSDAMRSEFQRSGVDVCDETEADVLVILMDVAFDYDKLTKAMRAAMRASTIIVSNEDRMFPSDDGMCPGCAAMVASILAPVQRGYDVFLGKPATCMIECVSRLTGLTAGSLMVIGDGVDSDIAMADAFGSKSLLIGCRGDGLCVNSLKDTVTWNWNKI